MGPKFQRMRLIDYIALANPITSTESKTPKQECHVTPKPSRSNKSSQGGENVASIMHGSILHVTMPPPPRAYPRNTYLHGPQYSIFSLRSGAIVSTEKSRTLQQPEVKGQDHLKQFSTPELEGLDLVQGSPDREGRGTVTSKSEPCIAHNTQQFSLLN